MDFVSSGVEDVTTLWSGTWSGISGTTGVLYSTDVMDVRQYSSVYVSASALVTTNPPTNFNQTFLNLWWSDASTIMDYAESCTWISDGNSPYLLANGGVNISRECRGPYLKVDFGRYFTSVDVMSMSVVVIGTTRKVSMDMMKGGQYVSQIQSVSSGTANAGTTTNVLGYLYPGRVMQRFGTGAGGTLRLRTYFGPSNMFDFVDVAASSNFIRELITPTDSMYVTIQNTGGVNIPWAYSCYALN